MNWFAKPKIASADTTPVIVTGAYRTQPRVEPEQLHLGLAPERPATARRPVVDRIRLTGRRGAVEPTGTPGTGAGAAVACRRWMSSSRRCRASGRVSASRTSRSP